MNYVVQVVGDDELPEGRHVVIVERDEGPAVMLINGVPARVWALMRQWEDTGAMHAAVRAPRATTADRRLAELARSDLARDHLARRSRR